MTKKSLTAAVAASSALALVFAGFGATAAQADPTAGSIPYHAPTTQHTAYTATPDGPGELTTLHRVDIAQSQDGNYRQYRIPALIVTNDGTIVTSYDGRHTASDLPSHIDNIVRISHDGGATWDDQMVQRSGPYPDGFGDPSLGYDPSTNRIFLFYTGSEKQGFFGGQAGVDPSNPNITHNLMSYSDDDGKTWHEEDITAGTKDPAWKGTFAASGTSTYLATGKYAGRLVQQYVVNTGSGIGVVSAWTDDNGATWQHGAPGAVGIGNENKVAETSDGNLLLNLRGSGHRYQAISTDGGATWGPVTQNAQLVDPNDNGTIMRVYPDAPASDPKSKIMLSSNNDDPSIRMNTTIRLSCDDGQTWPVSKVLQTGSSAYSTLAMMPTASGQDPVVAALYERNAYKNITFASFQLGQLAGLCAPISLPTSVTLSAGNATGVPVTITNQQQTAIVAGTVSVASAPFIAGSAAVPVIAAGASVTVTVPVTADAQAPAATEPITVTYTADGASSQLASSASIARSGQLVTAIDDTSTHVFDGTSLLDLSNQLGKVQGATGGSISVTFQTTSTSSAPKTLFGATEKGVSNDDFLLTLNNPASPYYEIRAGSPAYLARCASAVSSVADGKSHTLVLTAMNGTTVYSLDGTTLCTEGSQQFFSSLRSMDSLTLGGARFQGSKQSDPTDQWFFTGTVTDLKVKTLQSPAVVPAPAATIEEIPDVYHYSAPPGLGVGDQISYMVRVTNTGNVPLTGMSSTSNIEALAGCITGTLSPGASMLCASKTHTFTQADVDARAFTSTVTLNATAGGAPFSITQAGETLPLPAPFALPAAPAASTSPTAGCAPTPIRPVAAIANTEESTANYGAENTPATNAIDGDPNTFWSSGWSVGTEDFPNWIIVDLGKATNVCALTYTPRQNNTNGNIGDWRAYVSNDPNDFGSPVAGGTFASGTATQTAFFASPATGRYLKLAAYNDIGAANTQTTTIAELSVRAVDPNYVAPTGDPALIPEPQSVKPGTGPSFSLTGSTAIVVSDATKAVGDYLAGILKPATGFDLTVADQAPAGANTITLAVSPNAGSGDEAYQLNVTGDGVTITGTSAEAVFDGAQTLRQLLPEAINSTTVQKGAWTIAPTTIKDAPRFDYRGGMLDVGRRFYPVAQVERFIDYLAEYKFNALHLHLTEDQGWRLAIDAYPALTQVGASVESGIPAGTVDNGVAGPWFYTKAQYKQIVDYAASRFIQVVPEIDGPGHMGAAMSAIPDLNCNDQAIPPWTSFGRGPNLCLDAAHIGNVQTFLTNVMNDVAGQTPGAFIHAGGDESAGLTSAQYTQYTQIANAAVTQTGKKVMAWNSWENGAGLPAGGVLQNYAQTTGDPGLAANVATAVAAGNKILMSPADRTYLDIKYDKSTPYGLTWINGGYTDLAQAYEWDPDTAVPNGSGTLNLNDSQIFGVEFALWADATNQNGTTTPWTDAKPFDPVSKYMDTMLFPRLPAVAEIAWSPKENRAGDPSLFDDFQARLLNQAQGWDAAGIGYSRVSDVPWKSVGAPALPATSNLSAGAPTAAVTVDSDGVSHFTVQGTVSGGSGSIQAVLDGQNYRVDAKGDYSLTVPAQPGANMAEVRLTDASGAQVGGPLTATASLGSLTVGVHPNEWDIAGSGLAPDSSVTLTLHSAPIALGTAHTDASGAFQTTVAAPVGVASGDHHVIATAGSSAAVATLTVTADPGTITEPGSQTGAGAGTVVAASGSRALSDTGSDVTGPLWVFGLLLAAGLAAMAVSRVWRGRKRV
ncbi:hypothetical protein GCM10028798_08890 [Humibacter antri]